MFWSLAKTTKYILWDLPCKAISSCCRRRPAASSLPRSERRRAAAVIRTAHAAQVQSDSDNSDLEQGGDGVVAASPTQLRIRRPAKQSGTAVAAHRGAAAKSKTSAASDSTCNMVGQGVWRFLLGSTNSIKTTSIIMFCLVLIMEQKEVDEETFVTTMDNALTWLIYLGLSGAFSGSFFKNTHHTDWFLETLEQSVAWIYLWLQDLPGDFEISIAMGGLLAVLVLLNNYDPDNGLAFLDKAAGNRVTAAQLGVEIDSHSEGNCAKQTWRAVSRIYKIASISTLNYFLIRWAAYYAGDVDRDSNVALAVGITWGGFAFARSVAELSFGGAKSAIDLQRSSAYKFAGGVSALSQSIVTFTQVLEFVPHFMAWVCEHWLDTPPPVIDLLEFSLWSALTYGTAALAAIIAANDTLKLNEWVFRYTAEQQVVHLAAGSIPEEASSIADLRRMHVGQLPRDIRVPGARPGSCLCRFFIAPAVKVSELAITDDARSELAHGVG